MVRLRNLGTQGILTDPDPYSLPLGAFSGGVNVRFRNNTISSAPVFRAAIRLGTTDPRFASAAQLVAGTQQLFVGYKDGTVKSVANSVETDVSIASYTPSAVEAIWSSTVVGDVAYINRSDRAPWYMRSSDTTFKNLGVTAPTVNDWANTWSCRLLRQCTGALVALNVTKGATTNSQMVKTSSLVQANQIPVSWDQTTPNTLASENTLSAMDGPIQDACNLGQDLIIYGAREAWRMHADGSTFVYDYTKLPFKKGSLNANCSVEIDGKNYVFGLDDIWVHDGNSEKSLCDQKTRDFIFASANIAQSSKFFVTFNPRLNELYFCYVSGDQYVNYRGNGCNRSAVYNITNDSWSFDDLPSVFFGINGPLSNFLTYTTVTSAYDAMGGSYQDQEDGGKRVNLFVGDNSVTGLQTTLYAFDLYGIGSVAPFPVDPAATGPVYLERVGIDLDELEANLRDYKTINSIFPQARLDTSGGSSLMIDIGASDFVNSAAPSYDGYQAYDGKTRYKLDFNAAGRWLSIRMKWADYRTFSMTGFDLDIQTTGRR
jgi:hypothetical protein